VRLQQPIWHHLTSLPYSGIITTLDKQTKENKMMTRKDFVVLAATIANIGDPPDRAKFALLMLPTLKAANPRFNEAKFLAACKVVV
jgi:hypothetical protein